MTLEIRVDPERCEGTGFCARLAPHVFELRDGVVALRQDTADEEHAAVLSEAETLCPTQAIRVVRAQP